jgi:hypothetical protein
MTRYMVLFLICTLAQLGLPSNLRADPAEGRLFSMVRPVPPSYSPRPRDNFLRTQATCSVTCDSGSNTSRTCQPGQTCDCWTESDPNNPMLPNPNPACYCSPCY